MLGTYNAGGDVTDSTQSGIILPQHVQTIQLAVERRAMASARLLYGERVLQARTTETLGALRKSGSWYRAPA